LKACLLHGKIIPRFVCAVVVDRDSWDKE